MVWIRGPGEVRLVTGIAGCRRPCIHVVHMALHAVYSRVRTSQRKRSVVVIERCPCPRSRRMTRVTGGWEARRRVVRVGRPIPVCRVAAVAICRQRREIIVCVALSTGDRRVRAR